MANLNIDQISTGLKLSNDGIWQSSKTEGISYPAQGNNDCFVVEDNSFWFNHRNKCIVELLHQFPPAKNTLFDIGGGNGCVSAALMRAGFAAVLVEPGPEGAKNAQTRSVKTIICSTLEEAQFKNGSLPGVGLFDVIEHIDNDVDFLKNIFQLMQKDGKIYFTVPAYSFLWSHEDIHAGHFRRHTQKTLQKLVRDAGFDVLYSTYFFRPLPVPILLLRALPYRLGLAPKPTADIVRDHGANSSTISSLFQKMLNREVNNIRKRASMMFGGSILLAAEKK